MKFSIIIPVLNEEKRLPACLDALKNLDYPTDDYEVIIVDNGSIDNSIEIVKLYGYHVITETQKGITFARQAGLLHAQGLYYITTDADARVPQDWLKTAEHAMTKYNNIAAVTGPTYGYDGNKLLNIFFALSAFFLVWLAPKHTLLGCNMVIKTDIAKQCGGFLQGTDKFHEDSIISKRIKQYGQIHVDWHFKNFISTRRYRGLNIINIFNNIINFFSIYLRGKNIHDDLPEIR
ncbi:MAG: hypothetical protein COU81_02625 [Candidatus Portnoybacteria bacterium CG10_big_fil_rev_8_21_14_0_10_36_7]|uniref:Glycosyltransferase 2-like domain-containing protein n=1 Tax=Candidatus Portnoybacteria bacterium CG10_big_fil_rev_8_21_14_0_10_36_7 TaxID=1974812 RepID=A0A2M8KDU5_9BACT|nr:MAG: hypothetical protein COU81_02625 [Candidatus Portnoybacteria bacterium CG10_big_fil_rev_8_21_14_0_10_36_7]